MANTSPYLDPTQFLSPQVPTPASKASLPTFSALTPMIDVGTLMNRQGNSVLSLLPYLASATANANIAATLPTAQAQLQAAQQTSPQYAALMQQLYSQYAPMLAQMGSQVQGISAQGAQQNINNLLSGPGGQSVLATNALNQQINPEYYAQRANSQGALSNLINSINPTAGLTPTEMSEITQGLARQNAQAGTLFSPSQTQVLSNAMQYGQAGFNRLQANRSALSNALQTANQFLPQAQSGINAFGVGTAGMSATNPGLQYFTGINQPQSSNVATGLAGSLFGNAQQNSSMIGNTGTQMMMHQADLEAQAAMQRQQQYGQMMQSFGQGFQSMGSMGGKM